MLIKIHNWVKKYHNIVLKNTRKILLFSPELTTFELMELGTSLNRFK